MSEGNIEKVVVDAEKDSEEVKVVYAFTVKVMADGNIQVDPSEGTTPAMIETTCRDVYNKLHEQRIVETALQRLANNMAGLFAR